MLNSEILKILACPVCHSKLEFKATKKTETLFCKKCNETYQIDDGIAQLVVNKFAQDSDE